MADRPKEMQVLKRSAREILSEAEEDSGEESRKPHKKSKGISPKQKKMKAAVQEPVGDITMDNSKVSSISKTT